MAPAFEKAAAQLEPWVRFGKLNTDSEPTIAGRFSIHSIPTTIVFRNGQEVARQAGAMDLRSLLTWVQSHTGYGQD
jgi:thioredoxin 2